MGRLIIWNVMSLDGAFEGATPWDLSMHETVWGPELEALSKQQLAEATVLLFGRATYEGMAQYWQSAEARSAEGEIAEGMNNAPKAVISTTLKSADWKNSRLLRSIEFSDIGSATLTQEDLENLVRALGPASPPVAVPVPPGSPPDAWRISPADAEEYLRAAFRVWVTEVRPILLPDGGACAGGPPKECCILLGQVDFPVVDAPAGLEVDGDASVVTIDSAFHNIQPRPYFSAVVICALTFSVSYPKS